MNNIFYLLEIAYIVCLLDRCGQNWYLVTEEFNSLFNQNESEETLRKLYAQILVQRKLDFYKEISISNDYDSKIRQIKVKKYKKNYFINLTINSCIKHTKSLR